MLRQTVGSNKRGFARFSSSNFFALPSSGNWSMGRSTKSGSVSSISSNSDCYDSPVVDPEYIMQLVNDVRKFADVLEHLKEAFLSQESKSLHHMAHERLGELLRVLKVVINKHQSLNSVDILSATGTVISKVKGANYNEVIEDKREHFSEIFASIDTLAFTFGNVISDFLMGDVDYSSSMGLPLNGRSRSYENLSMGSRGSIQEKDDLQGALRAEEVDNMLLKNDSGIESALMYAKTWSKYTKDVLAWLEKRLNLDMEYARSFTKLAETAKTFIGQQVYMPFQSVYVSAFEYDIEYSQTLLQTGASLQSNKFIQPLLLRRNELDKQRKEIKEQWQREQRKMHEAETSHRKANLLYIQRQEEYEKARSSTIRAEEEHLTLSSGPTGNYNRHLEKKRKLEEDALQKAEEAEEHFKASISDANEKRSNMENIKSDILTQLRELVYQCDLTLKSVTVNLFQMQHAQVVSLPVNYQSLCENTKLYEPGQQYSEFVKSLPKEEVAMEPYLFQFSVSSNGGLSFLKRATNSPHSSQGNLSQTSGTSGDLPLQSLDVESPLHIRSSNNGEKQLNNSTDLQVRNHGPFRAWPLGTQGSGMYSDSESGGGSSESRSMDSPSASPGDFKRRLPRTPSTGTMSSADDLDEREPPSPSDNGLNEIVAEMTSSPGPFRNILMSKAAQTHKLRKLRAPSKCRECDSLVVFHGAECEECTLACHKKCLETLAIQCGHKKLHGRLHLFGVDFTQAAKNSSDGIPFIIKKCTSEIESRALNIKGIYRVNGAKSRVEKLCQAFENGKDLVELSDLYAHDISNVLKLFLRQLPEPLLSFRLYNEFIGLAKESHNISDENDGKSSSLTAHKKWSTNIGMKRILFKVKDLLRQLPQANYNTLRYLVGHLHRVAEKEEENKMSASNLGIIFGPTLIRPRQTDATASLSSLVDYPYQAQMVELFVTHYENIFVSSLTPSSQSETENLLIDEKDEIGTLSQEDGFTQNKDHPILNKEGFRLTEIERESSEMASSSEILNEGKDLKWKRNDNESDSNVSFNAEDPVALRKGLQSPQKSGVLKNSKSSLIDKASQQLVKVNMRPPRLKPVIPRPASLPVPETMISYTLNDKNSKGGSNTNSERSPIIEEIPEVKIPARAPTCCRYSYYDTQSLRRTWDKQYKCYDITQKTAMIMANAAAENKGNDNSFSPSLTCSAGNSFASSLLPNKPYTVTVKPVRTTKSDGSSSEPPSLYVFRPPRTLQPPPGTFYKPPSNTIKHPGDSLSKPVAALTDCSDSVQGGNGTFNPVDGNENGVKKKMENPSPAKEAQGEHKLTYQRLRSRRIPSDFEYREAHFV
ncbi:rho GTPase-activating protein 29-like isoform X1 [Scyliorhinus canicula]|uniref:rho GTPase-activating protein 29-like isoform X1 n=2 Tax=Scyliorhinus canicula TaxID=7830 RepID=UPI0018F49DD7|nr:rho GTPase-activating protein 29-like isoform X1 [Scyliorhinus canicula]XP_038649803.1 rho GTPase-activating protein 29-like isoform X1 [Scyliorhinus canicula]XP_038649804.1 rho GTPase-activating protein 29-like isoform X1 [Scyliorhinus canicula]